MTALSDAIALADELKAKATSATAGGSPEATATKWLAAEIRAERIRAEEAA